jgi:hypothetical protein
MVSKGWVLGYKDALQATCEEFNSLSVHMEYRFIKAPSGYPGKIYTFGHRALEHHIVWWQNTGQTVPKGFLLHHKNENKLDNRFENLELKQWGNHTSEHNLKTTLFTTVTCSWCGELIKRASRDVRFKTSIGQVFACNASHAALYGHHGPKP